MKVSDELEKTIELVDAMVTEDAPKINIVENKKKKISVLDFVPVLFYMIIAGILIYAGYYFLNTFDFMSLLGQFIYPFYFDIMLWVVIYGFK